MDTEMVRHGDAEMEDDDGLFGVRRHEHPARVSRRGPRLSPHLKLATCRDHVRVHRERRQVAALQSADKSAHFTFSVFAGLLGE